MIEMDGNTLRMVWDGTPETASKIEEWSNYAVAFGTQGLKIFTAKGTTEIAEIGDEIVRHSPGDYRVSRP